MANRQLSDPQLLRISERGCHDLGRIDSNHCQIGCGSSPMV